MVAQESTQRLAHQMHFVQAERIEEIFNIAHQAINRPWIVCWSRCRLPMAAQVRANHLKFTRERGDPRIKHLPWLAATGQHNDGLRSGPRISAIVYVILSTSGVAPVQ